MAINRHWIRKWSHKKGTDCYLRFFIPHFHHKTGWMVKIAQISQISHVTNKTEMKTWPYKISLFSNVCHALPAIRILGFYLYFFHCKICCIAIGFDICGYFVTYPAVVNVFIYFFLSFIMLLWLFDGGLITFDFAPLFMLRCAADLRVCGLCFI